MTWLILTILTLLSYLAYKAVLHHHRVFCDNGIKGPPPQPIVGNFITRHKLGYIKFQDSILRNYGPMAGYYMGLMPFLVVSETEMLKQILVKEFNCFTDRPKMPNIVRDASSPPDLLTSLGEKWKSARQILSPSFSAAKMRAMMPLFQKSTKTLGDVFEEFADSNKSVDVCKLFSNFTMETILATGFGRCVDVQRGENDQIVEHSRYFFHYSNEGSSLSYLIIMPILNSFPWLEPIVRLLVSRSKIGEATLALISIAREIVKERRQVDQSSQKYKDLLQLMIDAKSEDQQKLTDEQIVTHSFTFLLAGYETTSTTLAYVSYMLALNPLVQEKLQQEIDVYFEDNPDNSMYDATQEIGYLEKVIFETLRLHPPVGNLLRHCRKSTVINGVKIPEGVSVDIPTHIVHMDPKYWPNPHIFDPDRFSHEAKAKRPPLSYFPFGYGPRSCIGMRLALLEAKLALIHLLRKFTFVQSPETEVPLEKSFGITVTPKNGVFLKIAKRS